MMANMKKKMKKTTVHVTDDGEKRKVYNSLVMIKQCLVRVRTETVLSVKECLTRRLDKYQEDNTKWMKMFLEA